MCDWQFSAILLGASADNWVVIFSFGLMLNAPLIAKPFFLSRKLGCYLLFSALLYLFVVFQDSLLLSKEQPFSLGIIALSMHPPWFYPRDCNGCSFSLWWCPSPNTWCSLVYYLLSIPRVYYLHNLRASKVMGSSSGTTSTCRTFILVSKVNFVILISQCIMKHDFNKDFEELYKAVSSSCLRTAIGKRKIIPSVLKSFLKIFVHLNIGTKHNKPER